MIRSGSLGKRVNSISTSKGLQGFDRRSFLRALGSVALVSFTPGVYSNSAGEALVQAELKFLSQSVADTLLRMLRLLFPHDAIDDRPYVAVVGVLDQMIPGKPDLLAVLNAGVQELDGIDSEAWLKLSETRQLEVLVMLETTPFFQTVRVTGRFLFYDNKMIWPYFGYEGSSYEHGGYLHHGFNDLHWLPEPED